MTSHSLIRKALALALCTVLAVGFSAAVTGSQVHAKTKYKLPKKIVEYYWADEGLKWIMNKDTFKYNKKVISLRKSMRSMKKTRSLKSTLISSNTSIRKGKR